MNRADKTLRPRVLAVFPIVALLAVLSFASCANFSTNGSGNQNPAGTSVTSDAQARTRAIDEARERAREEALKQWQAIQKRQERGVRRREVLEFRQSRSSSRRNPDRTREWNRIMQ